MSESLPMEIVQQIQSYVPRDKYSKCAYDLCQLKAAIKGYSKMKQNFKRDHGIEFHQVRNHQLITFSKFYFWWEYLNYDDDHNTLSYY